MKNFVIEVKCQTASFRNPNFQNFHKSLELPPPTTIIGLAGAALGYTPLQAQDFFNDSNFEIGIGGFYGGKCLDTWKYNKGIRDMRFYDPGIDGSIIQKEYLINASFLIAFDSENEEAVRHLRAAFGNPVYALTMGNSDSLAHIKNIEENVNHTQLDEVENCYMQGNVVDQVIHVAKKSELEFSIYANENLTYNLPLRFEYENDYGRRTTSKIETYSFIGKKMKLNYEVKGVTYKEHFIPLFSI